MFLCMFLCDTIWQLEWHSIPFDFVTVRVSFDTFIFLHDMGRFCIAIFGMVWKWSCMFYVLNAMFKSTESTENDLMLYESDIFNYHFLLSASIIWNKSLIKNTSISIYMYTIDVLLRNVWKHIAPTHLVAV